MYELRVIRERKAGYGQRTQFRSSQDIYELLTMPINNAAGVLR
jgi:hypothetical protein